MVLDRRSRLRDAVLHDDKASGVRKFLYLPWIEAHGDVLLRSIFDPDPELELIPLRFTPKGDKIARRALFHFASRFPKSYAKLFERRLLALPVSVHGLVLTHDWAAPMHIAAEVAKMHDIPVILIPHEGTFMDEKRYYRSPLTGVNCSIADRFLAWGHLQKDIMVSRGYPEENMTVISSPKLQAAARYTPKLSRDAYCKRLGLSCDKKIVMFSAQTLDNVANLKQARQRQADAVIDLHAFCRNHGHQLVVRLPPVQHETRLQTSLRANLGQEVPLFVRPGQGGCEAEPHEATWHADCVASISSTMLLEKGLMNGPSLAFDYIEETSPFVLRGRLPSVRCAEELQTVLPSLMQSGTRTFPDDGWAQLEHDYSNGDFRGDSAVNAARTVFKEYDVAWDLASKSQLCRGGLIFPEAVRAVHGTAFKVVIRTFSGG